MMLIDNTDFNKDQSAVKGNKEKHYVAIKRSIQQKDVTMANVNKKCPMLKSQVFKANVNGSKGRLRLQYSNGELQ